MQHRLFPGRFWAIPALVLSCAAAELPPPPHPDPPLRPRPASGAFPEFADSAHSPAVVGTNAPKSHVPLDSAASATPALVAPTTAASVTAPATGAPLPAPPAAESSGAVTAPGSAASPTNGASAGAPVPSSAEAPPRSPLGTTQERCASVPPLGPDGAVPPAPPHAPVGVDLPVEGDRPVYVLPGRPGDPRVIVYLHGMCGDVTAADYFREAVRAHGTLIALRGDTPCAGDRFKWRDPPSRIQERVVAALARVNADRAGELTLDHALLFGYSQGADRAEKLAARFPKVYRRVVLGGAPMKASPTKLAHADRVAFLGGELETTETMRAGFFALQGAGIASRFFTLECAYHGYFGIHPEAQLSEALGWVTAR